MTDFVIRPGDPFVMTGYDRVYGNFALEAGDGTRDGSKWRTRTTTKNRTRTDAHLLSFRTCDGAKGVTLRAGLDNRAIVDMRARDLTAQPDGDRVKWTKTAGQKPERCREDIQRFQFVPKDKAYRDGAPLCPAMDTSVRVYRRMQAKPWMAHPQLGTNGTADVKFDTDNYDGWKLWRTNGWVCDADSQCKPWSMDNMDIPTNTTEPYKCTLEQDKPGQFSCNCVTTADRLPLFSSKGECNSFCTAQNNNNKKTPNNNKGGGNDGKKTPNNNSNDGKKTPNNNSNDDKKTPNNKGGGNDDKKEPLTPEEDKKKKEEEAKEEEAKEEEAKEEEAKEAAAWDEFMASVWDFWDEWGTVLGVGVAVVIGLIVLVMLTRRR